LFKIHFPPGAHRRLSKKRKFWLPHPLDFVLLMLITSRLDRRARQDHTLLFQKWRSITFSHGLTLTLIDRHERSWCDDGPSHFGITSQLVRIWTSASSVEWELSRAIR
jgi:hypothetical protein